MYPNVIQHSNATSGTIGYNKIQISEAALKPVPDMNTTLYDAIRYNTLLLPAALDYTTRRHTRLRNPHCAVPLQADLLERRRE